MTPTEDQITTARRRKAEAMAATLHKVGITPELAMRMDADEWRKVAALAGVNPPGSEETKNWVYRALTELRDE